MFFSPLVHARFHFSAKARKAAAAVRPAFFVLFILVMAAAFFGCVPKSKVPAAPPVGKPTQPSGPVKVTGPEAPSLLDRKELLKAANTMFREKKLDEAFDLYGQYIQRFPEASLIPAILMRMSRIKKETGQIRTSRKLLEQLIHDHPDSSFAADAKLGLLAADFDSGDYKSVLASAAALLKTDMGRIREFKILLMVGDTYAAMNVPVDAVYYYGKALSLAKGAEKRRAAERLDRVARLLDGKTMDEMARGMTDTPIKTYLLFQLALNAIEEEQYEQALSLLSELVATHPDAPQAEEAQRLLDSLNEMAVYEHRTVGCLLPLTGAYAAYGQRALKGIEYALSVFSRQQGAPTLHIKVKDTASDDKTAVRGLMDLYAAHVAAVIGPIATVEAVVDVAQKKKMPLLTLTQKENVAKRGDFIFRNFITPRMQVKALVNYAAGQLGISRFAVLYPDEKYGNTFMNLFWDQVMSAGGQIKGAESYDPAATDFADAILKLVGLYYGKKGENQKPVIDFQALFIPDAPSKAGLIVPQLVYHDIENVLLMGTNLWHSNKLLEMAGQYLQGAVMVDGFFAESDAPVVQQFVAGFTETFGEAPGFIEAVTFDTATILFDILGKGGVRFRFDLKNALLSVNNYPGLTGFTSFTSDGDAIKTMYLLQVHKDGFKEMEQVYVE